MLRRTWPLLFALSCKSSPAASPQAVSSQVVSQKSAPTAAVETPAPDPECDPYQSQVSFAPERPPRQLDLVAEMRWASAAAMLDAVARGQASGNWRELKKPCCGATGGASVLVVDEQGRSRALLERVATEHSGNEVRSYFDETGRRRLIFFLRNDDMGGSYEELVLFGDGGQVEACDVLVIKEGSPYPSLCAGAELRTAGLPAPGLLDSSDPKLAFERCGSP